MAELQVRGTDDFLRLSKALKNAGKKELRKELHTGMRKAAKPLIPKARAEARRTLPQEGGLAERVARAPMRVQVRTGSLTAGVRVVVGKDRSGARAANRGVVRHPVFGNREKWVEQPVPRDWFDRPMRASAPEVRSEVLKAVQALADKIVKEAR